MSVGPPAVSGNITRICLFGYCAGLTTFGACAWAHDIMVQHAASTSDAFIFGGFMFLRPLACANLIAGYLR
jgi:hypothetical protein